MAAHKYWRAVAMQVDLGRDVPIELSEFQLYNGATRLDAAATLTASTAPASGTLASLKDGATSAGPLWNDNSLLVLYWAFPSAVEVDGIVFGARTTVARFPRSALMLGSDVAGGPALTIRGAAGAKFVSAQLTPILPLGNPELYRRRVATQKDYSFEGGRGLITDTVKTKATPANLPTFCKVRLVRDLDGKVIRETWTHPVTGAYRFDYFDETFTYTVIAIHPLGSYRAVLADRLTPGIMP